MMVGGGIECNYELSYEIFSLSRCCAKICDSLEPECSPQQHCPECPEGGAAHASSTDTAGDGRPAQHPGGLHSVHRETHAASATTAAGELMDFHRRLYCAYHHTVNFICQIIAITSGDGRLECSHWQTL